MANQITDNRTNLDTFEATTNVDDLAGSAAGTLDNEIFFQGSNSVSTYCSNTRAGLLYDAGSAQNWANNVFYMLFNSGIAGLLATKTNRGVAVRFCGATVTDWFEVAVAGSDDYPPTFSGGWAQFVVDIEEARTAAVTNGDAGTATNGTPPATSAIRYVGFSFVTGGTMPRMVDNTWIDQFARLPNTSPGIIVEGTNGGTTDWTLADIATAAFSTNKWATARPSDGGAIVVNTPIQIGINDTTTHEFTSLNELLLWDNQQFLADGFYKVSALGNSGGTTNVTFGQKSGTGTDATGSQGGGIQADSTGARFDLDFDDPNLDVVGLYGLSMQHGGTFQLDDAAIEVISSLYIDCTLINASSSLQQRISIINPNNSSGVAAMTMANTNVINNSTIDVGSGHGIELTGAATDYTLSNVTFQNAGADTTNTAALYVSAGTGTFNISVNSTTTYRSGGATVNIILNPVTLTIKVQDEDLGNIQDARVLVQAGTTGDLPYQDSVTITRSGSTATVSHTAHGLDTNKYIRIDGANQDEYNGVFQITVTGVNSYTYTVSGTPTTPATGTIIATGVIIFGLTDVNGEIADTRTYGVDQSIDSTESRVRKGSGTPVYYKDGRIVGSIDKDNGSTINVTLLFDE